MPNQSDLTTVRAPSRVAVLLAAIESALDGTADDVDHDGRDAELLPEGDASELDELDEAEESGGAGASTAPASEPSEAKLAASIEPGPARAGDHLWDRTGQTRRFARAMNGRRLDGTIACVDPATQKALVHMEVVQPHVPDELMRLLPRVATLSLHEKALTPALLDWMRKAVGRRITFSLSFDDNLAPIAIGARRASD